MGCCTREEFKKGATRSYQTKEIPKWKSEQQGHEEEKQLPHRQITIKRKHSVISDAMKKKHPNAKKAGRSISSYTHYPKATCEN